MNTMNMLFNQPAISTLDPSRSSGNLINNRDAHAFKKTLDQTSLNVSEATQDMPLDIRTIVNNLSQPNDAMSLESMMTELNTDASFSVSSLLSALNDTVELSEKELAALLENLETLGLDTVLIMEMLNIDMDTLSQEDMLQLSTLIQLQPVLEQLVPMLKELNMDQLSSKDWLKLLDQYTGLPNDLRTVLSSEVLTEENQTLLKDMLAKFESRMALSEKGYVTHGKVTTDDIMKWLAQAMDRQSSKSQPTFGEAFATSKGTQPLEQLTIHLSQSASTNQQTLNQELMDQFEAVLQKMQVGKNLLGQQQIKLQLNPNNLGQITVEMMEIDGEMFVKLIATSEMAKEALEANMKELRHMFSPHQVIVEQEEQASIPHASELLDYQEQDENKSNQDEPAVYFEEDEEAELSFSDILSQEGVYL